MSTLLDLTTRNVGEAGSSGPQLDWEGAPSEVQDKGPAFHARTYLVDRVLRRLRPNRMLDIGCGRGYVTAMAARHARQVVATDVAPGAVAATADLLARHPDARVLAADVLGGNWGEGLRERGTRFDVILLSEVLEHLDDDLAALITCRDLLSEGGSLLLTVPGNPALWTRWDDLAGHRRRYTREELIWKLEAAGFRVRQLVNWGFPLTGWLAIRGARMRARRVEERNADGEVPTSLQLLLPAASIAFRVAARIEPWFSRLDRGAGYVAVAERASTREPSEQRFQGQR